MSAYSKHFCSFYQYLDIYSTETTQDLINSASRFKKPIQLQLMDYVKCSKELLITLLMNLYWPITLGLYTPL